MNLFPDQLWLINVIGFTAVAFVFWKKGGNQAATEVIATYREQVSQLKEENKILKEQIAAMETRHNQQLHEIEQRHNDKLQDINKELATLQARFVEVEKKNKELNDILASRDPNSINLQTSAISAMQQIAEIHSILKAAHPVNGTQDANHS